ncbi:hypothetical protein [Streptomyces sp. NPDC059893]|uniref:hypothetical protein n=1 Tax=Streptomyces sp. NPDC059893 TaxID=3346990 RepID=UPI0036611271
MPNQTVPFVETQAYKFKCQAEEAHTSIAQAAVRRETGWRPIGTEQMFCHVAVMPDGTERLLLVVVANPAGSIVALLGPLDRNGSMWLATTTAGTYENSIHADVLSARAAARTEATERGAWAAAEQDEVYAAYAANPRRPLCEHCGR